MDNAVFMKIHQPLEKPSTWKEGRGVSDRAYLENLVNEIANLPSVCEWGVVDGT